MSDKKQKIILAQIETQEVPQTEFSQFEIVNAVEASSPGGLNKKKLIYIGEGNPVNDIEILHTMVRPGVVVIYLHHINLYRPVTNLFCYPRRGRN